MEKIKFNIIDKEIIRLLYNYKIPLTIGEISRETKISWITVKKHIQKLLKLKIVEEVNTHTRKTPKIVWNIIDYSDANMASA